MKKMTIPTTRRFELVYNRSYIIRLWREDAFENTSWRASLEDPLTGERFGFAGVEQLYKFIKEHVEMVDDLS